MENELMSKIAKEFHVPTVGDGRKIWFLRTQSGTYYNDFIINNYVALGWDKVDIDLISNQNKSLQEKKKHIALLYPEEKRPGLILSQIIAFYLKMQPGDLIVIPSTAGKSVSIGILGEITNEVTHKSEDTEYSVCHYFHCRKVKWMSEVFSRQDIYLFKMLRAQQTISDISSYSEMVYRNLYSFYIGENDIHITLQKFSDTDYTLADNVLLLSSILDLAAAIDSIYESNELQDKIIVKTAVGSPGFIEMIAPCFTPGMTGIVFMLCLAKCVLGKARDKNGITSDGILGVITKFNELLNDHELRKKTRAETKLIEAQAQKTNAETRKIEAEVTTLQKGTTSQVLSAPTLKVLEESDKQNAVLDVLPTEKIDKAMPRIIQSSESIKSVTLKSGIIYQDTDSFIDIDNEIK